MYHHSVVIYTLSHASWRDPRLNPVPTYIEDTYGEDALDHECVSFDECIHEDVYLAWEA